MKPLLLILIILNYTICYSQNLLNDGSFEDTISTPSLNSGSYLEDHCTYWTNSIGANYFTNFSVNPDWSVPQHWDGMQDAKLGSAYAGITLYDGQFITENRTYIVCKLSSKLTLGKKYKIELYLSMADSMMLICNNLGIYFSDTTISYQYINGNQLHLNLNHAPEIQFHKDLSNKNDWIKLDTIYSANGHEQWITIGNFLTNSASDTSFIGVTRPPTYGFNWLYSYYYIDDVSVELFDDTGLQEDGNAVSITILPNPNNGGFTIKADAFNKPNTFVITDAMGQVVDNIMVTSSLTIYKNNNLPNGIYFCTALSNNVVTSRGKFLVQR